MSVAVAQLSALRGENMHQGHNPLGFADLVTAIIGYYEREVEGHTCTQPK
jgi:hypothetical protein